MHFEQMWDWLVLGLAGVCAWVFKNLFNKVSENEKRLRDLEKETISRSELKEGMNDIKIILTEISHKLEKHIDNTDEELSQIKQNVFILQNK